MRICSHLVAMTALTVVAAIALIACSAEEKPTPAASPMPTPNILATVTAAFPTAAPTPDIGAAIAAELAKLEIEFRSALVAQPTPTLLPTYTPYPTPTASIVVVEKEVIKEVPVEVVVVKEVFVEVLVTPTPQFRPIPSTIPAPEDLGTPATDREVLTAFYQAAGGPGWPNQEGWLTSQPLSQWYGVTTNHEGRVAKLELDSNDLRGTITPALGNLSGLVELWIGNNDLTGPIPPELGNLRSLEVMWLPTTS